MARSKSSNRWLDEHFKDPFVKKAQKDGLRSRAAYKLMEVQEKRKLVKKGDIVVDLGAAPGGWTQVVRKWVGDKGEVFALDILEMEPMADVKFIQGDFTENSALSELEASLEGKEINVVLSDMAPNMSGIKLADQARAMYLVELALDFAKQHLTKKGSFFIKVFQGAGIDEYIKLLRATFKTVIIHKPAASRKHSREVYVFAQGLVDK